MEKCGDCKWWTERKSDQTPKTGNCYYEPPKEAICNPKGSKPTFCRPETSEKARCSKFEQRPTGECRVAVGM